MGWKIDPARSEIAFSVRHMMVTTVRGRFKQFAGDVTADPADLLRSKVEGTVDMASIDTRDAGRDAYLRSADFFDVEQFPQMKFACTKIERGSGGAYRVTGDLTIRDVTRPVTFTVRDDGRRKDRKGILRWGLSAEATINRKEWKLGWGAALESGGMLVGEKVKINAEIQMVEAPGAETAAG
jgi:polyisoprenoid-binding protein YceI